MHGGGVTVVPMEAGLVLRVAQDMRASDRAEIAAMSAGGVLDPVALAGEVMARSRWGAVVLHDGRPAVAMGLMHCWPGTANVWLFATDAWESCWRTAVRWVRRHLAATMREDRITCCFVFADATRLDVGRLLGSLGFVRRGTVPNFGAADQPFALWSRTGDAR